MGPGLDFEVWYEAERPRLVRALWAVVGDRDLAVDAADEAFSRALARWDRVAAMDSPSGWVRTVALNVVRRAARRRSLERGLLRRANRPEPDESIVRDLELWRAVAALPERQREVVAMRYMADCSEAEIAVLLGITEGAVSASLVKARRHLAEGLQTHAEAEQA